jgi:hypothetical protein
LYIDVAKRNKNTLIMISHTMNNMMRSSANALMRHGSRSTSGMVVVPAWRTAAAIHVPSSSPLPPLFGSSSFSMAAASSVVARSAAAAAAPFPSTSRFPFSPQVGLFRYQDPRLIGLISQQAQDPRFSLFLTLGSTLVNNSSETVPASRDDDEKERARWKAHFSKKVLTALGAKFFKQKIKAQRRRDKARRLFRQRRRLFQVHIFRASLKMNEQRVRRCFRQGPMKELSSDGLDRFVLHNLLKSKRDWIVQRIVENIR